MAKLSNKGFFLVETIAVVGIVTTILVLFYSQISVYYHNYERNAKYNTVESIHAVRSVKEYIKENYTINLVTALSGAGTPLLDITNYDFDTNGFYDSLVSSLNIKKIYFTLYNINNLVTNYATYNVNANFLDYLKTLTVKDTKANTYRLIIILNDETYSNVYFPLTDFIFSSFEVLVVAGGGGGASGGGGGGGVVYNPSYPVTLDTAINVTVGAGGSGGAANGGAGRTNGSNSIFGTITAIVGGAGGPNDNLNGANSGGSGGGGGATSTTNTNGGLGTSGQGNVGGTVSTTKASPYPASGGGGAGGPGFAPTGSSTSGNGGIGYESSILGSSTFYAGGGGGSTWSNGTHGIGGTGGGGNGGYPNGSAGTANSGGGGGGGAGAAGGSGGAGGSGIVIVRYPGSQKATGGAITFMNEYTIHTFTSGTVNFTVPSF